MILLPWSIITLLTGNTMRGLGILIIYAVVVIARQIIEPKIVGKHVGLRPIVTLTCMYAGSKLFGGLIGLLVCRSPPPLSWISTRAVFSISSTPWG